MHLTNHVCRHTFVTRLCEKGVNPKSIAQIIGHAKTDYVIDIYALIEKKQLGLAIQKLEEEISSNIENEYTIKLNLYKQAINYATSNGIAVIAFINNTIQEA